MEIPKDYSNVYKEEVVPMPATRGAYKSDGFVFQRRYEAVGIDPNELSEKLLRLTREEHKACATNVLQQHYRDVGISHQNKKVDRINTEYGVYIQYLGSENKDVYLVRVARNTLREVKDKMPLKPGPNNSYRLFFLNAEGVFVEVSDDEAILPYQERNGKSIIRCRVFSES